MPARSVALVTILVCGTLSALLSHSKPAPRDDNGEAAVRQFLRDNHPEASDDTIDRAARHVVNKSRR
jgi:hypothetical protein